ncbi:LexA family transcriptional regulator [Pseudomonas aeruginosa]
MSRQRRPLAPNEALECARLKAIYLKRKAEASARGQAITQESVGEACGWASAQSTVNQYMSGKLALNLDALLKFSQALSFSPAEVSPRLAAELEEMTRIANGLTDQGPAALKAVEPNAELIGCMSPWDDSTPLGPDEVAIPLYKEVELAGGAGATEVVEVPGRLLRFARSTLREAGVDVKNAACATLRGRSMERLIMDGATIGIDRGATHIEDGEIYAFDHDGMLRVKFLYRLPGGGLRIRSENDEEYPDEFLTPEQAQQIRVLGWVFWWSTVRRKRGLRLAK